MGLECTLICERLRTFLSGHMTVGSLMHFQDGKFKLMKHGNFC